MVVRSNDKMHQLFAFDSHLLECFELLTHHICLEAWFDSPKELSEF